MTGRKSQHTYTRKGAASRDRSAESGKAVLLVLLGLVVLAAAFFLWQKGGAINLDPRAENYFKAKPEIPREGNGWFVLMGLDILPERSAHEAGLNKFDIMRGHTAHGPVPPELDFQGDIAAISCWYNGHPEEPGCPDMGELDQMMSENFDLLVRLETLYDFEVIVQPIGMGAFVSRPLVENLFHLKMAELTMLLADGRPEDALELWVNGWRILRRLSLSRVDLEWRNAFAGLLNEWIGLFPPILAAEPAQLEDGGKRRLFYLLRPLKTDDMNFEGRLKHLGFLIVNETLERSAFSGKEREEMEKRLKNLYFAHVMEMGEALEKATVKEMYDALIELREEEARESTAETYHIYDERPLAVVKYFHEEGMDPLIRSFQADLANNDYSRMLILDIDAYDKHVPEDKMQAHLDIQREFMQCQVTGKPFVWDPERKDIYFQALDDLERRLNVMHLVQGAGEEPAGKDGGDSDGGSGNE